MANVWLEFAGRFQRGLKQLGLADLVANSIPERKVAKFVRHLRTVYPDYWSHYENNPAKMPFCPLKINKKTYANLVHLARELARQASNKVEGRLKSAHGDFKQLLADAAASPDRGLRQLALISRLFDRFPCGLSRNSKAQEKLARFAELRQLYKLK